MKLSSVGVFFCCVLLVNENCIIPFTEWKHDVTRLCSLFMRGSYHSSMDMDTAMEKSILLHIVYVRWNASQTQHNCTTPHTLELPPHLSLACGTRAMLRLLVTSVHYAQIVHASAARAMPLHRAPPPLLNTNTHDIHRRQQEHYCIIWSPKCRTQPSHCITLFRNTRINKTNRKQYQATTTFASLHSNLFMLLFIFNNKI